MDDNHQAQDRFRLLPPADPAPRMYGIVLSVFAHLIGLALIIVPWRTGRVRIRPVNLTTAQSISKKDRLPFKSAASKLTPPRAIPSHLRSSPRTTPAPGAD